MHKAVTAVTVVLTLAVISAVAVFAYLQWIAGKVENTFTPDDEGAITIEETFVGNDKENVSVDVGDPGYSVYVRAAIVVTWVNADEPNKVLATPPVAGVDYEIVLNVKTTADSGEPWFKCSDGFYYYETAVASGNTGVLIESCTPLKDAPTAGYVLNVRIISQTIQALGTTDDGDVPAVKDAWGVVTVENGKLVPNP